MEAAEFTRLEKAPRRSRRATVVEQESIHRVRGHQPILQATAAVAVSTRRGRELPRSRQATVVEQESIHRVRGRQPTLQVTGAVAEYTRRDRELPRLRQAMEEDLESTDLHDDLQVIAGEFRGEQDGSGNGG